MDSASYRLGVVTTHPIQYQTPLFSHLVQHEQINLTVYFENNISLTGSVDPGFGVVVTWDRVDVSSYQARFLNEYNEVKTQNLSFWEIFRHLMTIFRQDKLDAVLVFGYASKIARAAHIAARLLRIPVFLRGESEIFMPRSRVQTLARDIMAFFLTRTSSRLMYIGKANLAFYKRYGNPDSKLFFAPYGVDNQYFISQQNALMSQRKVLRQAYGYGDDTVVIVFSAKLIERKRPMDLLKAYQKLHQQGHPVGLLFIGEGPLRQHMESYLKQHEIEGVHITGFKNVTEMAQEYIVGDIFVLPSSKDTWGLVVNEAMLFGMPAIVTDRVGSHYDLIEEGVTGFMYEHGDVDALVDVLVPLVTDADLRHKMGHAARQKVEHYSYETNAQAILKALASLQ
ncbi:MAG: glycosyltransferase family 4 protein [Anaerolineae bacterium]|nr:glycosyltransferase family 4 protein [Anaerolineae bacterium]